MSAESSGGSREGEMGRTVNGVTNGGDGIRGKAGQEVRQKGCALRDCRSGKLIFPIREFSVEKADLSNSRILW